MNKAFSSINVPTFVAVMVFLAVDKKLGISNKILGMTGS